MSKISVCIATYNGEKYIREQLESILVQLSGDDEIIISDDYSMDNTIEVIKSIKDKRIKIYFNTKEKGYVSNFENALEKANNDIIFLSDQDDVWKRDKVEKMLLALNGNYFVVSDAQVVNEKLNTIEGSFYSGRKPYKGFAMNVLKFGYLGCCMAFKREVLEKALPFPRKRDLCTHDNWLFLVAALYYNVEYSYDKLILYRRHDSNVSNGGKKERNSLFFKLKYRTYLLYNLLKR